jgi:hypothetical protein
MMQAGLRGGVTAQAGCYRVGPAVLPGKVLTGRRLPVSAGGAGLVEGLVDSVADGQSPSAGICGTAFLL